MLREWRGDLHIHTALSPCADSAMTPGAIVGRAKKMELDLIAIADHNSAENVAAVKKAAEREGLAVIGGMEISSAEEVHVLALLEPDSALFALQDMVYRNLHGVNDASVFGEQPILNENDEVMGFSDKLLIGATTLSLDDVVDEIHSLGGMAIASHVDREGFGILGQLGFIPNGLKLDGVEFSPRIKKGDIEGRFGWLRAFPRVQFSDAHRLGGLGGVSTSFLMEEPTLVEVMKALAGSEGRKARIYQ